jgi:hypothetical protein
MVNEKWIVHYIYRSNQTAHIKTFEVASKELAEEAKRALKKTYDEMAGSFNITIFRAS